VFDNWRHSSSSSSSSRMRVMSHNWSATKQRLHRQSVAEISAIQFCQGTGFNNVGHHKWRLEGGDIANEEIARDLLNAENLGQQVIKKLVMERLLEKTVSLHSSITKQKLKTFASMFVIQMAKDKHKQTTSVIKAARDLLLCPWRPEDLDALLQTELCHVLLSQ